MSDGSPLLIQRLAHTIPYGLRTKWSNGSIAGDDLPAPGIVAARHGVPLRLGS